MTWRTSGLCVNVACWLLASLAFGQEGPATFEFSFSNPGARSMGLGGAFAALADDATAAFANPAGLVQLLEPEISLEGRSWWYNTPFVLGGRVSGDPTGIGLDTEGGLRYGTSSNNLVGIPFLSFVYPGNRWAIAAYRHQWANFAFARQVDGLFGEIDGETQRSEDVLATTNFQVTHGGLVGAYEVAESLSLGIGVVYFQAKMSSTSEEFATEDEEEGFFDPNPHEPELLDTTYFLGGRDSGVTLHAGFLWHPSSQWSVGGYFRDGPNLTMEVTEIVGPANDELPAGTVEVDAVTPLHLPTVYGLGVAYRTQDGTLTASFEWDRVRYSSIIESLDATFFDRDQTKLYDGDELRLGMEYVFITVRPIIALRLGAWRDPAHGLDSGPEADMFERTIFRGGDDQFHFTGGAGLVTSSVQFDFGFDLSKTNNLLSFSFVHRF